MKGSRFDILNPAAAQAEREAGETRRFTIADLPQWGEWLVGRIADRYAGFNERHWLGKVHSMASDNSFLFIRNERAVMCVGGSPRILDGGLVLLEIFALSRDARKHPTDKIWEIPDGDPGERPLLLLYRHARDWAKSQKAARLFVGQFSDFSSGRIRELMKPAYETGWVSVRV